KNIYNRLRLFVHCLTCSANNFSSDCKFGLFSSGFSRRTADGVWARRSPTSAANICKVFAKLLYIFGNVPQVQPPVPHFFTSYLHKYNLVSFKKPSQNSVNRRDDVCVFVNVETRKDKRGSYFYRGHCTTRSSQHFAN